MPKTQPYQERRSAAASVTFTSPSIRLKRNSSVRKIKDSLRRLHSPQPNQPSPREQELEKQLEAAKIQNAKQQEEIQVLTLERDEAETELHDAKRISQCLREDHSNTTTMLAGACLTIQTLLRERSHRAAELLASQQRTESLTIELSMHTAMATALATTRHETRTLEAEKRALETENKNLEAWIRDIKSAAREANSHYNNLRSKLRNCEAIIAHLQRSIDTAAKDADMNKKALLRANTGLKRDVDGLRKELDEQKHRNKSESEALGCSARADGLEVCGGKSRRSDMRDGTDEYARLRGQALARWRALDVESSPDSCGSENSISTVVTLPDQPPREGENSVSVVDLVAGVLSSGSEGVASPSTASSTPSSSLDSACHCAADNGVATSSHDVSSQVSMHIRARTPNGELADDGEACLVSACTRITGRAVVWCKL